jgi:hypothetical protein
MGVALTVRLSLTVSKRWGYNSPLKTPALGACGRSTDCAASPWDGISAGR